MEGREGLKDGPVAAVVAGEEDAEEEGPDPEAGIADAGGVIREMAGGGAIGQSRRRRR